MTGLVRLYRAGHPLSAGSRRVWPALAPAAGRAVEKGVLAGPTRAKLLRFYRPARHAKTLRFSIDRPVLSPLSQAQHGPAISKSACAELREELNAVSARVTLSLTCPVPLTVDAGAGLSSARGEPGYAPRLFVRCAGL